MAYSTDRAYRQTLAGCRRITPGEEAVFIPAAQNGDKTARDALVESVVWLVASISSKYSRHGIPKTDLMQEGAAGAAEAVDKFDPARGKPYSACAGEYIERRMHTAVRENLPITFACNALTKIKRINEASRRLTEELGREPTHKEVARATGDCSEDYARHIRTNALTVEYACDCIRNHEAHDIDAELEKKLDSIFAHNCLEKLLAALDDKEREVIRCRYGLDDKTPKSLRQTLKALAHLPQLNTAETVSQIEERAIKKMRRAARIMLEKGA